MEDRYIFGGATNSKYEIRLSGIIRIREHSRNHLQLFICLAFYLCLFLLLRMTRMITAVTNPQSRRITPTAIRNTWLLK